MYRYQKMLQSYLKMDEFVGYEVDYTVLKGFYFEEKIDESVYQIQVMDGAYRRPKVKKIDAETKRLETIQIQYTPTEIRELYERIVQVMDTANKPYELLIPGYVWTQNNRTMRISYIGEDFPHHRMYPMHDPEEIRLWIELFLGEQYITEIRLVLRNKQPNTPIPYWHVAKTNAKTLDVASKEMLQQYIQNVKTQLNKMYRVRALFSDKARQEG